MDLHVDSSEPEGKTWKGEKKPELLRLLGGPPQRLATSRRQDELLAWLRQIPDSRTPLLAMRTALLEGWSIDPWLWNADRGREGVPGSQSSPLPSLNRCTLRCISSSARGRSAKA